MAVDPYVPEPNIILFGAQVGHSPARECVPRGQKCATCQARTADDEHRRKGLRPYCSRCNAYALDHRLPKVSKPRPRPAPAIVDAEAARATTRRDRRRLKFGGRLPASLSPSPEGPSPAA